MGSAAPSSLPEQMAADDKVYLRPVEPATPHYRAIEVLLRGPSGPATSFRAVPAELRAWAAGPARRLAPRIHQLIETVATSPAPILRLGWERPRLMGVVNVTPDSFSDGGRHFDAAAAIAHGRALQVSGADIIDVGGESTRPGAEPVSIDEELSRVVPVIDGLRDLPAPISIDTRHAAVMVAALAAGASIINDISALTADPESLAVAAGSAAPVVLMHCLGDPRTMQQTPSYDDVLLDIFDYLEARVAACVAAGIDRSRLIVDPGIGFGKTVDHNLEILRGLAVFQGLGCPIMVGVSRKSFIAKLDSGQAADQRLPGSLAAGLWALSQGARILRVHDVGETIQAIRVWSALQFPPAST